MKGCCLKSLNLAALCSAAEVNDTSSRIQEYTSCCGHYCPMRETRPLLSCDSNGKTVVEANTVKEWDQDHMGKPVLRQHLI